MNAVDTNVLLYSVDDSEPAKQARAQLLLRQLVAGTESSFLLWQVLAETVHQLRRWHNQGELTEKEFDLHVQTFRTLFPLAVPSQATLNHALDLAKRYSLAYWDSMILAHCAEAGVKCLYTEDMGAPRTIGQIQLVNPLT